MSSREDQILLNQNELKVCQDTLKVLLNKRKEVIRQLNNLESDIVFNKEQITKLEEKIRILDESIPKNGMDYDYTLD